jgi:hypothetical protein
MDLPNKGARLIRGCCARGIEPRRLLLQKFKSRSVDVPSKLTTYACGAVFVPGWHRLVPADRARN